MEGLKAMPNAIIYTLAIIGLICLACIVAVCGAAISDAIKSKYKKNRAKRIYENRFNKKPLANCYCKDCLWFSPLEWDETVGKCDRTGRNEPDNFFCNNAHPKNAESILRKENEDAPMDDE